jgi:hypothetical protein
MPAWELVLLGVAVLVLVPVAALAGRGVGKRMRGNLAMAAMLLGLGEPLDPPSRRLAEASHKDEEESEAAGARPRPDA